MRTKKEINIQIGEQIKKAREFARLTQEQLAEYIEVSPQFVSDLERGVVGISLTTLKRVCTTLCVSCDQILFGKKTEDRTAILAEKCAGLDEMHFDLLVEIVSKYVEAVNLSSIDSK